MKKSTRVYCRKTASPEQEKKWNKTKKKMKLGGGRREGRGDGENRLPPVLFFILSSLLTFPVKPIGAVQILQQCLR